jgi:hypothetical protein
MPKPKSSNQPIVNPLSRFVSRETVAMHLKKDGDDIYRVNCWRYVVHVVGKGTSTFVSYADLPPIVGVDLPNAWDVRSWKQRWKKCGHIAPLFWHNFYVQRLQACRSMAELQAWEEIIAYISFGLPESSRVELEGICDRMTRYFFTEVA